LKQQDYSSEVKIQGQKMKLINDLPPTVELLWIGLAALAIIFLFVVLAQ